MKKFTEATEYLMTMSTFGSIDQRLENVGTLIVSLENYLNEKRSEHIDDVRNAVLSIAMRFLMEEDDRAYTKFHTCFIRNKEAFYSQKWDEDLILIDCLDALSEAKKHLSKANKYNAHRKAMGGGNPLAGQALVTEELDIAFGVCQKVCLKYGMYGFDEKTMINVLTGGTKTEVL